MLAIIVTFLATLFAFQLSYRIPGFILVTPILLININLFILLSSNQHIKQIHLSIQ
jgi:hypothetical protein